MKRTLGIALAGASALAISPALAQTAAREQAQSGGTAAQNGVADIVVTAQRRDERLQEVPISVAAMPAATLERAQVRAIYDLQTQAPALVINRYGNATVAFIRGVGSLDGTPGLEGSVALYVDGIYHAAPFTSGIDFNNIARVEVLKGPQGTLFGRNATGGAIQIITRDPSHDPALTGSVSYGNFQTFDGRLYGTTGLTETLAADIAITYHDQGKGYGRNLETGTEILKDKNYSIRSKLLFTPSDALKIMLTGQYYDLQNRSDTRKPMPGTVLLDGSTFESTGGFYDVREDLDPFFHARGKEISGRIDYDAGALKIVSISGFQQSRSLSFFDQDGAPAPQVNVRLEGRFRTFTQELQLLSPNDSPIRWIVGGFFMKDRSGFGGRNGITIYGPAPYVGGAYGTVSMIDTTSYSGFAEATIPIGDKLRVTGGVRYSRDERRLTSHVNILDLATTNTVLATIANPKAEAHFSKPTWRGIVDYHFTPTVMAYASVSRGFKSGNFNPVAPTDPAFRPEILTSYEAGVKTDLFNRHVRFNLSGYYYRYNDLQLTVVIGPTSQTVNAGKAELAGAEAETQFVFGGFNLNVSAAYAYSKFLRYTDGVCFVPNPAGGDFSIPCDHTGERLPKSPKLTFNVSPSYTLDTEAGKFVASMSWYHSSRYRFEPSGSVYQSGYDLVNGRLAWTAPNQHYGLSIFVKNATRAKYAQYAFGQALGDDFAQAPPRTYGVEASFNF